MDNKLYMRLAAENIKKNGRTYIPYILTCILTVAMFYMIGSLANNPTLLSMKVGGNAMAIILALGTIVVGIFAVIFLFYTNSFLMKRRKKEFGLYNILGMGKRHIAKVVALETLYTAAVSLAAGLFVGIVLDKLMFLAITKILGGNAALGFYISIPSIAVTLVLFGILFLLILLNSLKQIVLSKPIELLRGGNVGEKEPKTKWFMTVLGVICLGSGYCMAVTVENVGIAIGIFFIAVILVILGTYMLFTAGSIFLLKALRKNKRYYYKPKHFISVSGMIYRMKQNAVGLANICILSTMVLVMISCTSALVIGIDDTINRQYPDDIKVTVSHAYNTGDDISEKRLLGLNKARELAEKYKDDIKEKGCFTYLQLSTNLTDDQISLKDNTNFEVEILTAEDYNKYSDTPMELNPDEIFIRTINQSYGYPSMTVFGKEYKVGGRDNISNGYDYPQFIIYVKNVDALREINFNCNEEMGVLDTEYSRLNVVLQYDIANEEKRQEIYDAFFTLREDYLISVSDKATARSDYAGVYGGLFFLGIFLGTLFITATILIIYYKQISEGYEDQSRFDIMQRVGMSKSEVRSAIHSQVLCVFFLPLITAGIHTVFAFNIVLKCMFGLGFANVPLYLSCTAVCFLAFAIMYIIIYAVTAGAYFKIVSR
ncbi:MAG: FtsX-like permease family protein [Firmicutes bacterium]|nr:FtsX-like permease family protein [[Eubacterium] siraeum]MCM1487627.1 FtsX-like permease family protein [Bacillota bacterium]